MVKSIYRLLSVLGFFFLIGIVTYTIDLRLSLSQELGDEITIEGEVIENNLGCEVDLSCYISIDYKGVMFKVIYHYGEFPPCKNIEMIGTGIKLNKNNKIQVYGKLIENNVITVCDSESYFIKKL